MINKIHKSKEAGSKKIYRKKICFCKCIGCMLSSPSQSESDVPNSIQVVEEYCNDSSLHGLKYIGQPDRPKSQRIFWAIAFTAGLIATGILINQVFAEFWNNPIVITFQASQANIEKVPFPAVTICNVNNIQRSELEKIVSYIRNFPTGDKIQKYKEYVYFFDQICTTTSASFSNKLKFTTDGSSLPSDLLGPITKELDNKTYHQSHAKNSILAAAQKCSDLVLLCRWEDETKNCTELFRTTTTDYGVCCTFNMAPLDLLQSQEMNSALYDEIVSVEWKKSDLSNDGIISENGKGEFPRRATRSGLSYGLSFLINPDEEEYFCTAGDSIGFQFAHHLPTESAHVGEYGIGISPNSEVFIKITPDITIGDPGIEFLDPEKRNCYLKGEQSLKYYVNYTYGNCIDECLANMTYTHCNCVRYYMTRDDERNLCGPRLFDCAEETRKNFLTSGSLETCAKCLATCTDISYLAEMTTRPMRKDRDIWIDSQNSRAKWAGKNVTLVHVYFGEDKVFPKIRKRLHTITGLIASAGGLLGLCLGFSALSGIELLYFVIVNLFGKRIISKLYERQLSKFGDKRNKWTTWNVQNGSPRSNGNSTENLFRPVNFKTNASNGGKKNAYRGGFFYLD